MWSISEQIRFSFWVIGIGGTVIIAIAVYYIIDHIKKKRENE